MQDLKIQDIKLKPDHTIDIMLSDGRRLIYDIKPKLRTVRFHDIENLEQFLEGKLVEEGRLIQWNINTELSLSEILHGDSRIEDLQKINQRRI